MSQQVIIYTQKTCGPCQEEKAWLSAQGVSFEDRDIRANDAYFQEAIKLGASSTPVTVVDLGAGEPVVIHGFDKDKIKEALNLA